MSIGVVLFLLTQLIYFCNLNHGLYVDELYHLLSAHSVNIDGTLKIADGQYDRAAIYTRSISFLFKIFGEKIGVAREFSSVTISLFILSVFYSLWWMLGIKEALLATIVLSVLPGTIYFAQFIRFYAIHDLVFWMGSVGVFIIVTTRITIISRVILFGFVGVLFGLAYDLQATTLIGLVAILSWGFLYLSYHWLCMPGKTRLETYAPILIFIAGLLILMAFIISGKLTYFWMQYQYVASWNIENKNNILFYHKLFQYQYPTFWSLYPVACIVALYKKPKPTFFFMWVFVISLLLFSLGGMKDGRYVIFLLPFVISIWAICFVALFPKLLFSISNALKQISCHKKDSIVIERMAYVIGITIFVFIILNNHAFPTAFHMLNGQQYRHEIGDWSLSEKKVLPLVKKADVVLTTNELEAQYYFKHFDFNFSRDRLLGSGGVNGSKSPAEFSIDPRTGHPVISSISSLNLVLHCYHNGVFLGDARKWYKSGKGLGARGVSILEKAAQRVTVNPDSRLIVFTWKRDTVLPLKECSKLYQYTTHFRK